MSLLKLSAVLALAVASALTSSAAEPSATAPTRQKVGQLAPNIYYTPANQILTPVGVQVELPKLRPQAIALSPDGRLLVTSGKTSDLIVIDPKTGRVLQTVPFPGKAPTPAKAAEVDSPPAADQSVGAGAGVQTKPDTGAQLSFTGLVFSPDGRRIYVSNVNGDIKVFGVEKNKVAGLKSIPLPDARAPKKKSEIPAGLAISRDGALLYVALNLGNRLAEVQTETGAVVRTWDVGVAPFGVVLAAGKAYVSNLGGRRPAPGDLTGPAGRGTFVRVDPVRHIANEGSLSVINLATGTILPELLVELRPTALAVSPDERYVVVANSGSDTLSVIDTTTDQQVEKIWARKPNDLFSATPNALAFDGKGDRLFVCNATQNAVGIIKFDPADQESKLLGLLPVGWFPGAIVHDSERRQVCVANIKGIGSQKRPKPGEKIKHNSKDYFGSLSLVPLPADDLINRFTARVHFNMRYGALEEVKLPARPDQPPRPVPERLGEPSVFKHVIYVIKENRTYDQVLGDVKRGNSDPSLCLFGEKFTPNQHKLVREFVLLDNTYCSGIQSADGHQWANSAITTDYVERGHAGWPRSYPNMKTEDSLDALAYAPTGFLWDNALKHGKTVRNYGEACTSDVVWADQTRKGKPAWRDIYSDYINNTSHALLRCKPGLESLRPISKLDTVGWDMKVPDVVRAREFIKELKQFEQTGTLPQLSILFLPNDHTGGTRGGGPTPGAQVADNDLAMGMVVEALSHSKFWKDTVLFAIEDDPQSGADHVSGYRTTCYVASAYTRRGEVVSTQYNQTSIIRTMELILGLPPMNLFDATATPMSDCFAAVANLKPFVAVPNQVPLDQLNPEPKKVADEQLRKDALASAALPLDEPDRCPEDLLNRILWRAMKGTSVPYPEWAITTGLEDDDD